MVVCFMHLMCAYMSLSGISVFKFKIVLAFIQCVIYVMDIHFLKGVQGYKLPTYCGYPIREWKTLINFEGVTHYS